MEYDPWRSEQQADGSVVILALVCGETGDEHPLFTISTGDTEQNEELADAVIAGHKLYLASLR